MRIIAETKRFLCYLLGKRSEARDLDVKDVVLAKTVLDIHRKRVRKELAMVPLFSLKRVHALDRENATRTTEGRAAMLRTHKAELLEGRAMTHDLLTRYLPSVSSIKVVQEGPKSYLAFEGNGRIAAMQAVFEPSDAVTVEVEQYCFQNSRKILRRLNRVRRLNGLL